MKECVIEAESGLCRLRLVSNWMTEGTIEVIEKWPEQSQLAFMTGRVQAAGFSIGLCDGPTSEQRALMTKVQQNYNKGPRYQKLASDAYRQSGPANNIDKRALRLEVVTALAPILGDPISRGSQTRFASQVANHTIFTELDFGGRQRLVEYWHSVHPGVHDHWPSEGAKSRLVETSLAMWLGVGRSEWTFGTNDQIPQIAQSIAEYSEYFLRAVPALLA